MSQASKIAESIQANHDLLSKNVLPQSYQFSNLLTQFYKKQSQDFESITSQLTRTVGKFKGKSDECESNIHQIETQWEKVKKFANTGKGYLNAKSEQIKSKVKNIDAVSTGIKQAVSKIKPQKLAQLPVQKNKSLQTMFKTLYAVLYHQKQSLFDWKSFKKLALKHQGGQDFLFRLVSINFKDMKHQQHEKLMILKNDPQFDNTCVKTEYAFVIIDIADWIQYVCVGHQFTVEKIAAEKEYDKIRKDMSKKSGGSLELSKKFWKEALDQLNTYQNNLESLQAELKSFKIGAQNSLETIQEGNEWRSQQIVKLNELLA